MRSSDPVADFGTTTETDLKQGAILTAQPGNPCVRYSQEPIEHYGRELGGTFYGPSMFSFLKDDSEAWNLAYLSFDFSKRPVPTDAQFTVLVRRTVLTRLDVADDENAAVDLLGTAPMRLTVRSLLRTPAPRFVHLISSRRSLLNRLPLYRHFGSTWLKTIEERSWLCRTQDEEADEDIRSTAVASHVLRQIASRGKANDGDPSIGGKR